MKSQFLKGAVHGIPIALGYLSVSFGFGIKAVRLGLSIAEAVAISMTNLTSAGQAEGVEIIAAGGTLIEMALVQLVINIRYSLMGLSLSQKLDPSFTTPHRLLASFGITDEIFAVASAQPSKITPPYMYGLILAGFTGWTLGTFLGAAAGSILPEAVSNAMGIMIYGMFIAIVIPAAKKCRSVMIVALIAAALGIVFKYLLPFVSVGFAVIICAAAAASAGALLFPVNDDDAGTDSK